MSGSTLPSGESSLPSGESPKKGRGGARPGSGGARPGAGRKPGGKNAATIEKETLRELYRSMVAPRLQAIVQSQLDSATGLSHFLLRDPETGQWARITDADQILAALNGPEDTAASRYMIYTKDPNQQATTDVLNRLMDKPKEQEQEIDLTATVRLVWDDTKPPDEGK